MPLAKTIDTNPGLLFAGLMTYPAVGGQADAFAFMKTAAAGLAAAGVDCPVVSSGGSPDMWQAETGGVVTEYRIGTYIYNDRSLVARGTCGWGDCAAHVLATVVSTPAPGRAIIDAGSKVLTSDLLGLDGHGYIIGHPDARIVVQFEMPDRNLIQISTSLNLGVCLPKPTTFDQFTW